MTAVVAVPPADRGNEEWRKKFEKGGCIAGLVVGIAFSSLLLELKGPLTINGEHFDNQMNHSVAKVMSVAVTTGICVAACRNLTYGLFDMACILKKTAEFVVRISREPAGRLVDSVTTWRRNRVVPAESDETPRNRIP